MPKPIGPIDEHFLDKETLKNTCIKLTDVWMTQGEGDKAETVGLDDITYILPPDTRNPSHTKMVNAHKTDIYGIMTIDNLKQLLDEGLAEVKRLHQKEGLLLRIPFRLVICFKNNMQANFTTIRERGTDRSSLTIRSRNYLQYEILSIQSATYERCRNFMDRTQLYEMMKRLKEDHNQPLEDCTVEWYIAKYKEIIRPADKHRRLICDKDDTDHTLKDGTSKRPRFLRHLASSDLKARFAAQAEWILANQIATASKETDVVNLKKWTQFCKKVQKARERAASEGVRWGIPAGYDLEELRFSADNPFGMERFGSHRTYWKKKLHNALKRVSSQRKAGQKKKVPVTSTSEASDVDVIMGDPEEQVGSGKLIYDDDYSDSNLSSESESESEVELVGRAIPRVLLAEPIIEPGCFEWCCPLQDCEYSIDLKSAMPPRSLWSHTKEPQVQRRLWDLASGHYKEHLARWGLELEEKGGELSVVVTGKDAQRIAGKSLRVYTGR